MGIVMDKCWNLDLTNVLFKHSDLTLLSFQNHNREPSCSVNQTSLKKPPPRRVSFRTHAAALRDTHILSWKVHRHHFPSMHTASRHQVPLVNSPNVLCHDLFSHSGEFLVGLNPWDMNHVWRKMENKPTAPRKFYPDNKWTRWGYEELNYAYIWKNRVLLKKIKNINENFEFPLNILLKSFRTFLIIIECMLEEKVRLD